MKAIYFLSFQSVLALFLFTGCVSFTSFQTADVLPKGKITYTVSGSMIYSLPENFDVYQEGNQLASQLMIRKGVSDNNEFQVSISPNSLTTTYKHLFHKSDKFLTSYTFGGSYTFLASSFDDQINIIDVPVSIYLTYAPSNKFNITLNPKVMYRYIGDESTVVFGTSLNFGLGKQIKIYPEGIFFYDAVIGNTFVGGGIGFSF
ncbi:MAG: hypothetical protein L3J74_11785 [Bacteroidales bacterium]|nr:hypothetical protein [Bacteroidales bacterium]